MSQSSTPRRENTPRSPTSSPFHFGGEPSLSSPFTFGPAQRSPSFSSSATTGSPVFTPSSTPSDPGTAEGRDVPVPSIERAATPAGTTSDRTPTTQRRSDSITTPRTPPTPNSAHENLMSPLRNLRIESTASPGRQSASNPQLQRNTSSGLSTPTIRVTPTASTIGSTSHRSQSQNSSIAHGISSLRLNSEEPSPGSAGPLLGSPEPEAARDPSGSPSPSRRRRSRSNTRQDSQVPNRHRVEDEAAPQSLFHARDMQEMLNETKSLAGRITTALSGSYLHQEQGSTIQTLHQQAIKLTEFLPPSSRIVGLVGDSGVGKSSLINCLLDMRDFARASSSGEACTCVVTEYHYHERNDFLIHVDYFSNEELKRQYQELLQAYRTNSSSPTDLSNEEREHLQNRADVAINTFRASFRERLDQNPRVLLSLPFDEAVATMMNWAEQLVSQHRRARSQESFNNIEQCSLRLKGLTSEMADEPQGCLWPFIRKLRVYLKAHILSKGLIIADLPGLRDLNSARQNVTERYVRQCHRLFAVTNITRSVTDPAIEEIIRLARHASLSNVGIICTHCDAIDPAEAQTDFPAERARINQLKNSMDDAQQTIRRLRPEIREIEDEIQDEIQNDIATASTDDIQELIQDLANLRNLKKEAESRQKDYRFRLDQHMITVRNNDVTRKLNRTYASQLPRGGLDIFCVSKTIYWSERDTDAQEGLPYLQLSGILRLRQHCIGIVADSHLRAAKEYMKDEIPALLGSIELWIQAGSGDVNAARKQQILDIADAIESHLDELTSPGSEIDGISSTLRRKFSHQIFAYMREQSSEWSTSAKRASLVWNGWHHSTYSAFCRNYGDHCTERAGAHCWNGEAIEHMANDLLSRWTRLDGEFETYFELIQEFIKSTVGNAIREARPSGTVTAPLHNILRTLATTIEHRHGLLERDIERALESFSRELELHQADSYSPVRTSVIGQLMEDSYHAANMEYGRGSDQRRKKIITTTFGSSRLFPEHRQRVRDHFETILEGLQSKIDEVVEEHTNAIVGNLDTLRDENVVQESERNPEFRSALGESVNTAKEEMDGIHARLDNIMDTEE